MEEEVTKAFAEERQRGGVVRFPVRLDDAVFATKEACGLELRDNRNLGDFRGWKDHDAYQRTLERILRDLRVEGRKASFMWLRRVLARPGNPHRTYRDRTSRCDRIVFRSDYSSSHSLRKE